MLWRPARRPHRAFWLSCRARACIRRLVTLRCGDRTCPECRARDYYRLRDRYAPILRMIHRPKLITLTLVNYRHLTREGISRLRMCMKTLFHRFEGVIRGGLYCIEVTNKGTGWHVHVHILADAKYIPQDELTAAWREITGDSYVVDIRAADSPDAGLRYLLKYLSKKPDLGEGEETEEDIRQTFNEAMKGVRLIQPFGSLYAYCPPRENRPCPTCGESDWELLSLLVDWPSDDLGPPHAPTYPGASP